MFLTKDSVDIQLEVQFLKTFSNLTLYVMITKASPDIY